MSFISQEYQRKDGDEFRRLRGRHLDENRESGQFLVQLAGMAAFCLGMYFWVTRGSMRDMIGFFGVAISCMILGYR